MYVGFLSICCFPSLTNSIRQDHPLFVWSQLRSEFLDEILKLDAFETDDSSVCGACNVNSGSYRCLNCVDTRRLCQTCIVAEHQGLPLHKIEVRVKDQCILRVFHELCVLGVAIVILLQNYSCQARA